MDDETCDKCGPSVRAYVLVPVGTQYLTYCGSCAARFWPQLVEVAGGVKNIADMRYLIP